MESWLPPLIVGAGLVVWTIWLHWPALMRDTSGLLAENADAVMSAWTLDWARAGRMVGPWTWHINPPHGAIAVPGGGLTARLLIPVTWVLGPLHGHDASVALILALGGLAVAWLVREVTMSWAVGALAGATLMGQPAILRLVRSGTLEHLAFWPLPAALAALLRALQKGSTRWAILGGLLLSLLPTESGYSIVFALLLLPAAAFHARWAVRRAPDSSTRGVVKVLVAASLAAVPLLIASAVLFLSADIAQLQGLGPSVAARNSFELRAWHDFNAFQGWIGGSPRSLGAFAAPWLLIFLTILSLIGLPRALPWLVASIVAFFLSLGPGTSNPAFLEASLGRAGFLLGWLVRHLNTASLAVFPFSFVRFPWRWLIPAMLAALTAASLGLRRLLSWNRTRKLPRCTGVLAGLSVGLAIASTSQHAASYRSALPEVQLPEVSACQWIRKQKGDGAVLLLPTFRQPVDAGNGVFGRIGTQLTGLDWMWLQILHGRPQNFMPENIPTLIPLGDPGPTASRWIQAADTIAFQWFARSPVSASSIKGWLTTDLPHRGVNALRDAGYRFIVADRSAYPGDWMRALQFLLGAPDQSPLLFPDGSGIAVFDLQQQTQ